MSRQALPICCHLSVEERDILEAMKAMTALGDGNLTRLALWHLARHLDVPIGRQMFATRPVKRQTRRPVCHTCAQQGSR